MIRSGILVFAAAALCASAPAPRAATITSAGRVGRSARARA
jgi:hypothetical protein